MRGVRKTVTVPRKDLVGGLRLCQESLNPGSPAAPHRGEEMTIGHKSLSHVNQEMTS